MLPDGVLDGLREKIKRRGLYALEDVFAFESGEDLDKPGLGHRRRTKLRLDADGKTYTLFLKRYDPERPGQRRRLRSQAQSEAGAETHNIACVTAAGIATMQVVHWGEEIVSGAVGRSFLFVTAVGGEALERCAEAYLAGGDASRGGELAHSLAELVGKLHAVGLVHRDLYASHIFLDSADPAATLHLIDLARVFAPRWRKLRWRVKDVAQLKYSMPADWAAAHWCEFMGGYVAAVGERYRRRFERAVDRKVGRIARHARRRQQREQRA